MDQRRYVVARLQHPTVTAAAAAIGIGRSTVYKWPSAVEECIAAIQIDQVNSAMEILRTGVMRSVMTKLAGLDSPSEKIQQDVATELIDRFLGKAKSEIDLNHTGSVESQVTVYIPDNGR